MAAHREQVAQLPIGEPRAVAFSGRFGRIEAPLRLDGMRRLLEQWAPDVVVYESADLAAPIADSEADIPFVHHAFGRAIPEEALRMAATAVAPLRKSLGLEPDPLAGAYAGSYVDICPPSLRTSPPLRPAHTFTLRPVDAAPGAAEERERPVVYATLGTIFNELPTFRLLLEVLATIDCDAVLTIGRDRSVADLAPIPRNVTVFSYLPQAEILDGCDAVIAHGLRLDARRSRARPPARAPTPGRRPVRQPECVCCTRNGQVIVPPELTVDALRDALDAVLSEPRYAGAARVVAAEIAEMPTPATVADQIAARVG